MGRKPSYSALRTASMAARFSMVDRSPGSWPVATRWMTRRRILPLRVLGSSATKRTASGANDLPRRLGDALAQLRAQPLFMPAAGTGDDEGEDDLALKAVGHAHRGRLGHGVVAVEDRLDLGRPQALAGHLDRVVAAAVEEPVAVFVDRGPVAVDPDVRPSRPVGRQVAVGIAPDPPRHRRPGLRADQLADALARPSVLPSAS